MSIYEPLEINTVTVSYYVHWSINQQSHMLYLTPTAVWFGVSPLPVPLLVHLLVPLLVPLRVPFLVPLLIPILVPLLVFPLVPLLVPLLVSLLGPLQDDVIG